MDNEAISRQYFSADRPSTTTFSHQPRARDDIYDSKKSFRDLYAQERQMTANERRYSNTSNQYKPNGSKKFSSKDFRREYETGNFHFSEPREPPMVPREWPTAYDDQPPAIDRAPKNPQNSFGSKPYQQESINLPKFGIRENTHVPFHGSRETGTNVNPPISISSYSAYIDTSEGGNFWEKSTPITKKLPDFKKKQFLAVSDELEEIVIEGQATPLHGSQNLKSKSQYTKNEKDENTELGYCSMELDQDDEIRPPKMPKQTAKSVRKRIVRANPALPSEGLKSSQKAKKPDTRKYTKQESTESDTDLSSLSATGSKSKKRRLKKMRVQTNDTGSESEEPLPPMRNRATWYSYLI
jgi:hypothetical protein